DLRGLLGDPATGHRAKRHRPALNHAQLGDTTGRRATGPIALHGWPACIPAPSGSLQMAARGAEMTRGPPDASAAAPRRTGRVLACLRWGLAAVLVALLLLDLLFPPPLPGAAGVATVVTAADGTPLRAFADRDGIWRHPATPESVSPLYLEALLTYEDRWFRYHPGINPVALARAAWQWLRSGRIVSGGSTLSMQVARIL